MAGDDDRKSGDIADAGHMLDEQDDGRADHREQKGEHDESGLPDQVLSLGPSATTTGTTGWSSSHSGMAGAFQNDHPSGGGGHSAGGLQPSGGRHPGGARGQFGGDRQIQSMGGIRWYRPSEAHP